MGPRHMPLNCAFMNGTVVGRDVWIPMSSILGGQQRCGFGWHMFVECLAEGRGVSLPAGAVGAARTVTAGVGAYARIRKQFRVPIAEFGGIKEALARAGREAYIVLAGGELMNAIVDNHEAPMVLSSIMKQSCTDRGRQVVQDGMDILGGASICQGNANFLGNAYMAMPVAITVEGANIMTRSFQIIGQGLTRCHPHMLPLIDSLQSTDADAPAKFRTQFGKMLGHVFSNLGLGLMRGVGSTVSTATRSATAYKDGDKLIAYHEAQLLRLSANFAFASDLALLLLEVEAQEALKEAAANFPAPLGAFGGLLMTTGVAPLGSLMRPYSMPRDDLTKEVASLLTKPSAVRDMFAENIYEDDATRVGQLISALPTCLEADAVLSKMKKDKREPSEQEAALLAKAEALRDLLVQVDVHQEGIGADTTGRVRPALTSTEARLTAAGAANFDVHQ